MNPFRNSRGEGLISVMVSIAILGVLIVTVVTLYQMYGSMMAKSLLRREADNVMTSLRSVLGRRELCTTAIAGNTWSGVGETNLVVRGSNGVLAQTGMTISNGRLIMSKVAIRPFQIDANRDGAIDSIAGNIGTDVLIDGVQMTSRSGEVVVEFAMGMDAVREGLIAERKAAVVVLVNRATNLIERCDINEESTRVKVCNSRQDAIDDGADCGPVPAPNVPSECEPKIYVGAVDAIGEPKCQCMWSCMAPTWRNRRQTTECHGVAAVAGLECPVTFVNGTVNPHQCYGFVGATCRFKRFSPGICGAVRPYLVFEADCMSY